MPDTSAPQSIEAFRRRLNDISDTLPRRLAQCADYFAAHSDRIPLATVAEVAAAAEVQPSTIIRFSKLLGFSGYSELQRLFRTTYVPSLPDYETRLKNLRGRGTDSPSAILAEFVDAGRISLENMADTVDLGALNRSVSALKAAEMIHVIGLRRAFPVAAYLAYALEKMNIPAMLHDRAGKLDNYSAVRTGDALVAIAFTPHSEETIDLVRDCSRREIPVVAITDAISGPLYRSGILPLQVSEVDFGAFRSLSATLSLAITIAVAVGAAKAGQ